MAIELRHRGIRFQEQVPVVVTYREEVVGEGKVDFLIEGCVIGELKAVEILGLVHTSQVVAYLRATGHKLAILVNFNVRKLVDGIKRVAR